jgi:hypothetical protein
MKMGRELSYKETKMRKFLSKIIVFFILLSFTSCQTFSNPNVAVAVVTVPTVQAGASALVLGILAKSNPSGSSSREFTFAIIDSALFVVTLAMLIGAIVHKHRAEKNYEEEYYYDEYYDEEWEY